MWNTETDSVPEPFPRIPVGYSYSQPHHGYQSEFACPFCSSPWSSEASLMAHMHAVHQQPAFGFKMQMANGIEEAENAFLLEGAFAAFFFFFFFFLFF